MVSNLAPDNDQEMNTHFSEQRVVESQQAYPSSNINLSTQVEKEMADDTWFAKQQLMKPVQLSQVTWSTSQARDTDIFSANFPQVLENVDSIVLRTLRMYAFYKLSPCFRIQINATQFHQGQLICSFDPFTLSSRSAAPLPLSATFDIFYATGLPNVKIMASESDAVELCVPYIHPRSFLTTNVSSASFTNLGALRISVLNPLLVADGTSPSVTVTIWIYAKDAQVHVPIFDHTPILDNLSLPPTVIATSQLLSSLTSSIGGQFSSLTNQLSSAASPIISSLRKGASQAHTMYGNLISGNIGQTLRTGQGLVDTLGDLFGFDYPARTIQPPKTISAVENLAVGIGQSQSQRMAIDPFSLHMLPDEVAGESIQSMNLKRIAQMPMLLSQFQFSSSQAMDSLLFSTPINPTVSAFRNSLLRRTYLSSVSNAFLYWSGGINFDIEIVATRFHSGKLLFAFVPSDNAIPTYAQAATSLPNILIDIQQTSSTRFKIPYVSSTPMKDCQRSYAITSTGIEDNSFSDSCIGTFVCYVQNTLAYASNVAPSVEVNIYISAADDFNLYVPAKPYLDQVYTPPTVVATSNQIGIDLNKNNDIATNSVLTKGSGISIPRRHFGEDYALIDILRRFNFTNTLNITPGDVGVFAVTPVYGFNDQELNSIPYITYFSSMYSAFSGSLRYKFVPESSRIDRTQMSILHAPDLSAGNSLFDPSTPTTSNLPFQGYATLLSQLQQDAAIEFEVPYYSRYNMLLLADPTIADPDISTNGTILYKIDGQLADDLTQLTFTVYMAAGEDFRFVYLRPLGADTTNVGYSVSTL